MTAVWGRHSGAANLIAIGDGGYVGLLVGEMCGVSKYTSFILFMVCSLIYLGLFTCLI